MTSRHSSAIPEQIGPYVVIDKIGAGGMATVYRAYHRLGGSPVALKVLAPHLADQPAFRLRFEREAYTLRQFDHPHILPVYDYGQDGALVFLVMRLVEGRSLADVLRAGPLPREEIGRYAREIASALDYAHARGIIHRDIKPANILLDTDNTVLLADFGVAYATMSSDRLTHTGSFVGTAAYASPEQCRGEPLDRRSDIYALAVLTFQMATGRLPFESSSALAVIKMHLHENPPNPLAFNPDLPLTLYEVLSRGMAKDPAERYPSAMKFSEALDAALGVHPLPRPSTREDWLVGNIAPLTFEEPPSSVIAAPSAPQRPTVEHRALPPEPPEPVNPFADPFASPVASRPERDPGQVWAPAAAMVPPARAQQEADLDAAEAPALPSPPIPPRAPRPEPPPAPVIRPLEPGLLPVSAPRRDRAPLIAGAIALIGLLAAFAVGAWALLRNQTPSGPPALDATYQDPTLGLTLDYPQAWSLAVGLVAALSADPTATIQLSDRAVPPGGPYAGASLVIQVQQIDPIVVYQLPPPCQPLIRVGPQQTFACVAAEGYTTPVYEPFSTPRYAGVRLPGTLPVARASIPVILLPTGEGPWIAVLIAHWDGAAYPYTLLEAIAHSLR